MTAKKEENALAQRIRSGEIAIIPTDTLYAIATGVFSQQSVEAIYTIRGRDEDKPCIILLASQEDLLDFVGEETFSYYKNVLSSLWPGSISIVLPVEDTKKWEYLHRGKKSLAFRVPRETWLRNFLSVSGPIIAPSANIQGSDPIRRGNDAREMFGGKVSLIWEKGVLEGKPSTLLSFSKNDILIVREGIVSRSDIQTMVPDAYCVK